MLRVPLVEARAGMVLASDVWHPHMPGGRLLRTGVELDDRCIGKLAELGVHEVLIRYPGLEDLARFNDPRMLAAYRGVTRELALVVDAATLQARVELDYWAYRRAVMGMLELFTDNPAAASLGSLVAHGDAPFVRHSGQVCVLSLLMALKLEFYLVMERARLPASWARDLAPLGVGAMLHDVGMTRLSPAALARWNSSRNMSDPEWQAHVRLGFEMTTDQLDPAAVGVILHHHQHADGSGFPARTELSGLRHPLAGSEIHVLARIAGAAELFSRLRYPAHAPGSQDAHTPPRPVVRVLNQLVTTPLRRRVDPVVLRALINVVPPFAPGTLVTLTGNRRAAVVAWSPQDPCRPVVELVGDLSAVRGRSPGPQRRLDLRVERDLSVIEAEGHDVTMDAFEPASPDEFDLARVAEFMTNRASADLAPPGEAA